MKKIMFVLIIAGLFTLSYAQFGGGSGTEGDPWLIESAEHLDNIRNHLGAESVGKYFLQTADIDLGVSPWNEGEGWIPLGETSSDGFRGNYNGYGYIIDGLYINRPTANNQGLFGYFSSAVVDNLGVTNVNITGGYSVSALVSTNYNGLIKNCFTSGSLYGVRTVGGLNGFTNLGFVENSYYNLDNLTINDSSIITQGALFGDMFQVWMDNDKTLNINNYLEEEDGVFLINNLDDFKTLLAFGQFNQYAYKLMNDIDLINDENFYIPYFTGNFDGNGYSIYNLSLSDSMFGTIGLFSNVDNATIKNLGLIDVFIDVTGMAGGLIGRIGAGEIINCFSIGNISGTWVGGLIGHIGAGTIIDSCYTQGNVFGSGNCMAGGLSGNNSINIIIRNSYSNCDVTKIDDEAGRVGGLLATSYRTRVENCYSSGTVTGGSNTGGLIANSEADTIINSYSISNVIGGNAENGSYGGLIGFISSGSITNCYSIGNVSPNFQYSGGMIGRRQLTPTIVNSYWNIETSGQETSAGGYYRTTEEMTYPYDMFTYVDWDFEEIWYGDETSELNNGYPVLRNLVEIPVSTEKVPLVSISKLINYPNPFNPETTIEFNLLYPGDVHITVYNLRGQKIRNIVNEFREAGNHRISWKADDHSGNNLPSGLYLCRLETQHQQNTIKMILLK